MSKNPKQSECRFYVGIDYGTSTSKLAYASPPLAGRKDPSVRNFPFTRKGTDSSTRYPSVVAFERSRKGNGQKAYAGFAAEALSEDVRQVNSGNVWAVVSPKMDLGEGYLYPFLPLEYSEPADLVALTLCGMVGEFEGTLRVKRSECRFLITVPSSFSSVQREELLSASGSLGIELNQDLLIDEPNAAFLGLLDHPQLYHLLRGSKGSYVMLVDFGAGTCDISLLSVMDDPTNEPYGLQIVNRAINDYGQLGGNDIDRLLADIMFSGASGDSSGLDTLDDGTGQRVTSFLTAHARNEKERLISHGRADSRTHQRDDRLNVPKLKLGGISVPAKTLHFYPEQLRSVVDSVLGRSEGRRVSFNSLVTNVLKKAGITSEQVGAIVLAGGSSKLFQGGYFRGFIDRMFPRLPDDRILTVDDPDLLISRGAAIECYNRFSKGKALIRPICPSNIGIRTAEGDYTELLQAGIPLPYPNQEDAVIQRSLYVPDPVPSVLRIPIVVQRFGEWKPVESWNIPLPASVEPYARLEFTCSMSLDKVLTLRCHSLSNPTVCFETRTTSWMNGKDPTPREERIARLRSSLRNSAIKQHPVAPGDMVNLVWEELKAEMFDLVRRRVEYLLTETPGQFSVSQQATLWNLRGLAADRQGDSGVALNAYLKAAAIRPEEAVYHYNVGLTYWWSFNDREKATAALRIATQIGKGLPAAWYWYGQLLSQTGDLAQGHQCDVTAMDLFQQSFTESADKWTTDMFRRVCDGLGHPYPDPLLKALLRTGDTDTDNISPSLIDHGDIIKLTPGQRKHETQPE